MKLSSTQVNLPADIAGEVLRLGASIADDDLAEKGRETTPHVTVRYGLHTVDSDEVKAALAGFGPVRISLNSSLQFSSMPEYDVVYLPVVSDDLRSLHNQLGVLENTETHPSYVPHVTLAYVKPGRAGAYLGLEPPRGEVVVGEVVFSPAEGSETVIPLTGAPVLAIQLDDGPVEQERITLDCSIREASDDGSLWYIALVQAGWSINGKYFAKEMLERRIPLFEGSQVAQYGWDPDGTRNAGHLPPAVRKALPLPGVLLENDTGFVKGVHGQLVDGKYALCATWECTDLNVRNKLRRVQASGRRLPGFSIDVLGDLQHGIAEGRRGIICTDITTVFETTVVTKPSAGGGFIERLVAAIEEEENDMTGLRKSLERRLAAKKKPAGWVASLEGKALCEAALGEIQESVSDTAVLTLVKKYMDAGNTEVAGDLLQNLIDGAESAPVEPVMERATPAYFGESVAELNKVRDEAKQAAEQAKSEAEKAKSEVQEAQKQRCAIQLEAVLDKSGLPGWAQEVIRKRLFGKVFQDSELQEAVQEFAPAKESGATGMAQPKGSAVERVDKLMMGLDLCFGYDPEKDASISEAVKAQYRSLPRRETRMRNIAAMWHDDQDMLGVIGPSAVIHEAATTANFPGACGVSMNKALVMEFAGYDREWDPFVSINQDVDNFLTQDRVQIGGFSTLPTRAESNTSEIADLGMFHENKSQYAVITKAGRLRLTREMIKNDAMGIFGQIPSRLARMCNHELKKFVYKLLVGAVGGTLNGDTIHDGVALYAAKHFNTSTDPLSHSAFVNARTRLKNQRQFANKTTLNDSGGINDSDTTMTFADATGLFEGDYVLLYSATPEYVKLGTKSTNTFSSCTRAQLGTSAAAHSDGVVVYQVADPIPLSTIYAIVPEEKEADLDAILGSEKVPDSMNNDRNFLYTMANKGKIVPITVNQQYLMSQYRWYLAADKKDQPGIEIAFMDNQQTPRILYAGNPTDYAAWYLLNYEYQTLFEFGGVPLDFRAFQGNLATT